MRARFAVDELADADACALVEYLRVPEVREVPVDPARLLADVLEQEDSSAGRNSPRGSEE